MAPFTHRPLPRNSLARLQGPAVLLRVTEHVRFARISGDRRTFRKFCDFAEDRPAVTATITRHERRTCSLARANDNNDGGVPDGGGNRIESRSFGGCTSETVNLTAPRRRMHFRGPRLYVHTYVEPVVTFYWLPLPRTSSRSCSGRAQLGLAFGVTAAVWYTLAVRLVQICPGMGVRFVQVYTSGTLEKSTFPTYGIGMLCLALCGSSRAQRIPTKSIANDATLTFFS